MALLWYHTILRPFYALDGCNVKAGVDASLQLIEESEVEYKDSAIFLFFRGRVKRLNVSFGPHCKQSLDTSKLFQSEIPEALQAFQMSVDNSTQRELKILSMHEVGWCHLIQLNYPQANSTFQNLMKASRWSKTFYAYLASICAGSCDVLKDSVLLQEILELLDNGPKSSQLEEFLRRRFKLFKKEPEALLDKNVVFWKLLIYEVLYLWNTLPSCSTESIRNIIFGELKRKP